MLSECSDLSPCPEGTLRQHQFEYLLILIAAFVALFGSFEVYEKIKEKYFSSDSTNLVELPEGTRSPHRINLAVTTGPPTTKTEAFASSAFIESALESNSKLNIR